MTAIRFVLIGGFLGAGKTTTISRLATAYQKRGQKVGIVTNQNYDPVQSGASVWDQVTIELVNGERIESEQVHRARGHAERPLGEGELFDKFRTCLDAGHARISPERLFDRLRNLERISARDLTAAE